MILSGYLRFYKVTDDYSGAIFLPRVEDGWDPLHCR